MTLTHSLTRIASAVVAISLVAGIAFAVVAPRAEAAALTSTQISAIISLLQSFGADATTVANVTASLNGTTPSVPSTPTTGSCSFTRDLTLGATGADVTALQQALIAAGYSIPAGATGYFGAQSQAAVAAWQKAAGITPAAGYFGPKSRAAFPCNSTTGPSTPTPSGTGLSVMAGTQPANGLAPKNASRIPFTRIVVTAGNDGDVTINGINVERIGGANNAAFNGVVLVNETDGNVQVGTSKTFNSNNQTKVGSKVVIPRGTSKTFVIAGNMASSLTSYAGQTPAIQVVGVDTTATVSGSLPIVGAYHTINDTLIIGQVTVSSSNAYASNSNQNKEIGTTGHKFVGFNITAGSAEDMILKSIVFNQTGSVSQNDLANLKIGIDGTLYDAMWSADGKYVWANFGSGITIPKGSKVEVYVQGDIIGSNASGRTVIFDIDKTTDIFLSGKTYGYGLSPTAGVSSVPSSRGSLTLTNGTPYLYATQITVTGAAVTTISKATEVPAQNIAVNVLNQPLGGFKTDIKGEAMTVQSMVFGITFSTSPGAALTNVTLVDSNGAVVAGPVDATTTGATQSIVFSDSVTFPTGPKTYTLRGKIPTGAVSGSTVVLSTTPGSGWTNIKGDTTGNSISLSSFSTSITMNTMTIKGGSVIIGRATTPASQTLVSGGSGVTMVNFQFDASQSGEDIRFSSVPVQLVGGGSFAGDESKLSACQLFDGTTALNSGSNVLNPSSSTATSSNPFFTGTIVLDNPVTITKGGVKSLAMKCNISASADNASTFTWDVQAASTFTFTGVGSSNTIVGSDATDNAIVVTIAAPSATLALDSSSPSYTLAAVGNTGATGVTLGTFKFKASNEALTLQKVGLIIDPAFASSTDVLKASIYDGATFLGDAFFTGNSLSATATLSQTVVLPKDTDKLLVVKADLSAQGTSQPGVAGDNLRIGHESSEGVGVDSGTVVTIGGSANQATTTGLRLFKSVPTVAQGSLSSTGVVDGKLLRFTVSADAKGDVSLASIMLNIATSTATATNIQVFAYTDSSYSQGVSGVGTSGLLNNTAMTASSTGNVYIPAQNSTGNNTVVTIPAGQTRYFEVRASLAGVSTGSSVATKLLGDSAFPLSKNVGMFTPTQLTAASNFIWSPNTSTSPTVSSSDFTNGFGVNGLPSSGIVQTRSN
ncbi:MAG: hypothetical protein RLZZ283_400 [Candidatus Parcubacteria bacterium]